METQIAILLVDDEPRNLQVLRTILDSPGHELVEASSADEALMALMQKDFAAIVLDVRMPNLDGIELAKIIKQRKKTQHIPIVFLTAYDQGEEQIVLGYGAGAVDYITKPVNPTILRSKIGVFIELFKKTRALAEMNLAMAGEIEERQKAEAALREANAVLLQQANDRARREKAEAAQAEAEAANRAKDHFLAMLSHELRTPLSPVLNAVTLLQEEETCSDSMRESLATIRRNIQLEARLIDDLLDLAKIRNGKLQLHSEPVDVHDLLHRALDICKPEIAANQLRVIMDLNATELRLHADPARVQQIFWNLITNAIKYTPPGGRLTLATSNAEGMVTVEISDSGIGIAPEKIGEIFDAFTQVHDVRSHGLGLGLAICRALVELHGGSIGARSAGVTHGATFIVQLPAASRNIDTKSAPVAEQPSAELLPLRLLLVEDHADTIDTFTRLLVRRGYQLRSARNMAEALKVAGDYEFDVLISDIGLPDGSGLDLMRQLTASSGDRIIHGIALSGYGMQEDLDRSRAAGFTKHFIKPVDIAQVYAALNNIGKERSGPGQNGKRVTEVVLPNT